MLATPQRRAVALLYGVGDLRLHSVRETARRLHVSGSRVRVLERRGVRHLRRAGRLTGCAGPGAGASSPASTTGAAVKAAFLEAANGSEAKAGPPARLEVAGRRVSSRSDSVKPRSGPATLTTPFGAVDKPADLLLAALLAAVLAGLVLTVRSMLRSVH
jgi:Sigma-70, region 4